ncbi:hypothetical protein [Kitasatospora sp. NPDC048407]|uniref:hypothetical protein n=1 Tax=Kitasatospora sp. NPDC048407 TaxID=3364051 RepID=UPI003720B118
MNSGLGAARSRGRHWQIQDLDPLAIGAARAQGDDPAVLAEADAAHDHLDPENGRAERHREVLLDHGEQAGQLLVLGVGIDSGLIDQGPKLGPAQNTHGATLAATEVTSPRVARTSPAGA